MDVVSIVNPKLLPLESVTQGNDTRRMLKATRGVALLHENWLQFDRYELV